MIKEEIGILDYHHFGCIVFVLDEKTQSALGGMPKWDPNARAGIYLGRSVVHSSRVALVLNMLTVPVSPQHHLVLMTSSRRCLICTRITHNLLIG